MTQGDDAHDVEWASAALRAIDRWPEKATTAVIEFVYTSLATSPHRVGRRLRFALHGLCGARRGDYRIVYRIDDDHTTIVIDTIAHCDVYQRRCGWIPWSPPCVRLQTRRSRRGHSPRRRQWVPESTQPVWRKTS